MSRLHAYYDRHARNYSLNWAIALTVVSAFYCFAGLVLCLKYFQHHDNFYLFVGIFNTLLGILGIFQGAQVTHAVVRRLIAEARHAVSTDR